METIRFSTIVPTWERVASGYLQRCLSSLKNQTYPHFEAIIVDDGSKEDVKSIVAQFDERFRYFRIEHSGRVIARLFGMEQAQNDWICWLDSDDEYLSTYFQTLAWAIERWPNYKVFNFGAIVHAYEKDEAGNHVAVSYTQIRPTFKPELNPEGPGHVHFTSGHIGTGSFIFHRSCLEEVEILPHVINFYELADQCGIPGYSAAKLWCGNPWGDDFVAFWRLTRKFESKPLDACLYVQHRR